MVNFIALLGLALQRALISADTNILVSAKLKQVLIKNWLGLALLNQSAWLGSPTRVNKKNGLWFDIILIE